MTVRRLPISPSGPEAPNQPHAARDAGVADPRFGVNQSPRQGRLAAREGQAATPTASRAGTVVTGRR